MAVDTTKYVFPECNDEEAPPPPYSQVCSVPLVTQGSIPKKKNICCYGAQVWTQTIAAVQITLSLYAIFVLFSNPYPTDDDDSTSINRNVEPYTDVVFPDKYQMFQSLVGLVLGVQLLVGSHMRKPFLLLIWLFASGFGLVCSTLILILLLVGLTIGGGIQTLVLVAFVLLSIGVQYFCYSVVSIHRREILEEQNNNLLRSFLHFNTVKVDIPEKNNFPYI